MSDISNAAAVRPTGRCCHLSAVAITCQPATHGTHPAAHWPLSSNMLDIPDTAAARPAHLLHIKFRVKCMQVRVILHTQECGLRAYSQQMFMHVTDRGSIYIRFLDCSFSEFVVTRR